MYPVHTWQYMGIRQRLEKLLKDDLDFESVLVSTQLIEQILKRVLRAKMSMDRVYVTTDARRHKLSVRATTLADIDKSLHMYADSIQAIKVFWRTVMGSHHMQLHELIDDLNGPGTWTSVVTTSALTPAPNLGLPAQLPYGLLQTRHLIVHGTKAADATAVRAFAPFGVKLVLSLIEPEGGVTARGFRNPLMKNFPFHQ